MIWKLLKKNISAGQMAGYAIANLIGLAIVLSAIRFYGDVSALLDTDSSESVVSEDFLVISKPVSLLNTITGASAGFSPLEVEDILAQPWATSAGAFTSADFNVGASLDLGGRGFSSFLFLESVPDEFIDVKSKKWKFDPSVGTMGEVPVIISKDYLALYNFGFAAGRGLPQISEGLVSDVPIVLRLSGNGHNDYMRARIVGFSSRLNTIAVPEDFMSWANARYSSANPENPSRLIVKVNRPGDPAINDYFEAKGYEVAGDKVDSGRASYFLAVLTSVIIAVGAVISLLALFILMLSIFLLMQKNRDKIRDLLLLGYSPSQVAAGYYRLIGVINASVLVLAIVAMFVASSLWESRLESLSVQPSSAVPAILSGIVMMAVVTVINFTAIYRSVVRNFRS
ncbi:MAG: ABC transporter permease [Muribaculaceae bacterium]|nr:ABC transporter permease [Muribaculaceae bacterium]